MRKIILGLGTSLDNCIARQSGAVDWLSMDWDHDWTAFFKTIDAVLMGRKTWEKALETSPPNKGKKNLYARMQTYVFSETPDASGVDGVEIVSHDLEKFVENLKAKDGKNIWLAGGGNPAQSFLNRNLVDEIHLGITTFAARFGLAAVSRTDRGSSATADFLQNL